VKPKERKGHKVKEAIAVLYLNNLTAKKKMGFTTEFTEVGEENSIC
jgi:hypothetical protein